MKTKAGAIRHNFKFIANGDTRTQHTRAHAISITGTNYGSKNLFSAVPYLVAVLKHFESQAAGDLIRQNVT